MDAIIYFFRNTLSGFTYTIYALILLFNIFAIIGYLVTQSRLSSK